jgi:hypothetical protein
MLRFPKPKDIKVFNATLEKLIPTDTGITYAWRRSLKDVPAWRAMGKTNDWNWIADIYAGDFFVAQVGTRPSETFDNLRPLVVYLTRMLQVKI